jgi:hypothetical protein
MTYTTLTILCSLLCLSARAQSLPPLPKVSMAPKAVVKGGAALIAVAPKAAALPSLAVSMTLAWTPPATLPDCYTVWGSTNLVNWTPILTCTSNQTSCAITQANAVEFFVIQSEIMSPPSNCVTNTTITK